MAVRKRMLLIAAALGLLAVAAALLPFLLRADGPISERNHLRVRPGTSRAEVEALYGGPPGDYRTPGARGVLIKVGKEPGVDWQHWFGDAGTAAVGFDAQGRVVNTRFMTAPVPDSFFTRALRRLGL